MCCPLQAGKTLAEYIAGFTTIRDVAGRKATEANEARQDLLALQRRYGASLELARLAGGYRGMAERLWEIQQQADDWLRRHDPEWTPF